jgi:diguanylate cyclase (GGDEF)-like protein
MSTVIRTERGPWGVLGVHTTTVHAFDDDDVRFLTAVANVLGGVINRAAAIERIRHQATHDPLTGLPNRLLLVDRLDSTVEVARRSHRYTTVIHLGLDRFGLVNETFGHEAGDGALIELGSRLRGMARPGDTVARYGGDEFVLTSIVDSPDDAVAAAAEVLAAVQAPLAVGEPPEEVFLSASVGVAVANGDADTSRLLRDAAAAATQAATNGGGRYQLHDPRLGARAVRRLAEERELRRALEAGEIEPHYQPVVDLRDGSVVGAEALARWHHPTRGLLGPGEFLARAEESGLMGQLGDTVYRQALAEASGWDLPAGFLLALNVAGAQLADDRLVESLGSAIAASGFDPGHLVVEIVEDALAGHAEAVSVLEHLRGLGPLRIHIDDFGTGHSSLARLHSLRVDGLKIDRSFVDDIVTNSDSRAIANTIIGLGATLGLTVIAEGIETAGQLAALRDLGCTLGQGWLFAKAMPGRDFARLISRRSALPIAERADGSPEPPPEGGLRNPDCRRRMAHN